MITFPTCLILLGFIILIIMFGEEQGYFCDGMSRNSVREALSQKDASRNGVPEYFSPGIVVTNTPLSDRIWSNSVRSVTCLIRKNIMVKSVLTELLILHCLLAFSLLGADPNNLLSTVSLNTTVSEV
jgi:hypothetical protein